MFNLRHIGALAALALLVAACGTTASNTPPASQAASAAPRVVQIEIGDGVITPATVTVTKGETVTFEVKEIAPGASKSLTFTFDGDGPYAYGDQIEDHYAKGAKGDIVLQ